MSSAARNRLPLEIYSVKSVREIDRAAIGKQGIKGYVLMTRAAESALKVALKRFPKRRHWQVVCGSGNNAGDGYVLARLAAQQGIAVSVLALSDPDKLAGDAAAAYNDFFAVGGGVVTWEGELDAEADLIVDGLLGSGLDRDVDGRYAEVVDAINAHDAAVLALDMPSGINGDTGAVMGTAVRADLTVTFVGLKAGLFRGQGPAHAGRIVFAGLGIPVECLEGVEIEMRRIGASTIARALPRRARDAHKGDFGHVVVVGGGPGMPGAVRLAGEAALRSGAGLVSVATHPSHGGSIVAGRPELMCHAAEEPADIATLLDAATVIALGPGLGKSDWARRLFDAVLERDAPLVLDADALNLLSERPGRRDGWILTPHPGEAARLLGSTAADVQRDRRAAVCALRERYGGAVVLKGAGTLIEAGGDAPWFCSAGNPGMAAAGMGDVLTGVIAALVAQGQSPGAAAIAGVELHARAGDLAAADGERGMLAGDVIRALRRCVNP